MLPTAKEVKKVLGFVDVGAYRIDYHDNWGNERFPWRVLGPEDVDGFRDSIEEFAQYRDAIRFAKKKQRLINIKTGNPKSCSLPAACDDGRVNNDSLEKPC